MSLKWGVDWGPGFRIFKCIACEYEWKEKCRDCTSPSISTCPKCYECVSPSQYQMHLEWPVDDHKNLVEKIH